MKAFIDQLDEGVAVLLIGEEGKDDEVRIWQRLLPAGVKEGDELDLVFFRRDNSADLERVRRLMDEVSGIAPPFTRGNPPRLRGGPGDPG